MRRYLFRFVVMCTISLTATCQSIDQPPFKIAAVFDLNERGPSSSLEKQCIFEGIKEYAISEDLNIEFVFYDNHRSIAGSINAAKNIVEDSADIVIAPLKSSEAIPLVAELIQSGIPIVVTGTNQKLFESNKNVFGFLGSDIDQAKVLAQEVSYRGAKKVGIVYNSASQYSVSLKDKIFGNILSLSPLLDIDQFEIHSNFRNFQSLAQNLVLGKYDVIVTVLFNPDIAFLHRELDLLHSASLILGTDSTGGRKEFYTLSGGRSNYFQHIFIKNQPAILTGEFNHIYSEIFMTYCASNVSNRTYISALSFDVAHFVIQLIRKNSTKKDFRDQVSELLKSNEYRSLLGRDYPLIEGRRALFLYEIGAQTNEYLKELKY